MIFNLVQFAISSHGTAPPTQLINENRTGKKKKSVVRIFHILRQEKNTRKAHHIHRQLLSLRLHFSSKVAKHSLVRNHLVCYSHMKSAISSNLNFRTEGLRSR